MYDIDLIRKEFPFFDNAKNYVYLDNAATTLKPQIIIQALSTAYTSYFANIGRGSYDLSKDAFDAFHESQDYISNFFGAFSKYKMVLTSGATEGINIVARHYENVLMKNDVIAVSLLEHHSNYLPWKAICQKREGIFSVIPFSKETGQIDINFLKKISSNNVKLAAVTHASNVTGIAQKLDEIISYLHSKNVKVIVDGSQSAAHMKINLDEMDPDFFVCSAHKILGPMGVGLLFVKKDLIEELTPFKLGGGMVNDAERLIWKNGSERFMAGTINSIGLIAFTSAVKFIDSIGFDNINKHIQTLVMLLEGLLDQNELIIRYGPSKCEQNIGIVSFNVYGLHAHDVGSWLNRRNIAVRVGHHCAQPLLHSYGVESCVRASLYLYNSERDVIELAKALREISYGEILCNR